MALAKLKITKSGQSGVLAMALPFAKPMIASDVGEFRETLAGGPSPCGLLVPPADAGALAAAILTLYENASLSIALGRAAKALADGPRSPAVIGHQALRIYDSFLRGKKARAA